MRLRDNGSLNALCCFVCLGPAVIFGWPYGMAERMFVTWITERKEGHGSHENFCLFLTTQIS